ncbi:hypothetical protein ACHAW5_000361 [Stephanodiscus triporus]|uniref:Uncharacterized protein n=1 Tax=Stephanodiscus triporus TaxID=2934178 RepID=A0ABD3MYM6_9STRA
MDRRNLLVVASVLVAGNNASVAFAPVAPSSSFLLPPPAANDDDGGRTFASSSRMSMTPPSSSGGGGTRRNFLKDAAGRSTIFAGFAAASGAGSGAVVANALDYDAFERGEIATDTARCDPKRDPKCLPKLSSDEALCQYGGGGNARGEACMRVRAAGGKLPPTVKKEKSLGGAYAMWRGGKRHMT